MLICDTHADTLYTLAMHPEYPTDITLERLQAGGVALQTLALYVGGKKDLPSIRTAQTKMFACVDALMADGWHQVRDPADAKEGVASFMLSVEGCDLLADGLEVLEQWQQRGVRMAALTWNYENCIATPATLDAGQGLKPFGREAVREMQRLRMAVDVSHLNERGFYELLDMGIVPLASHSCCYKLQNRARNLTDGQLRALFAAGGYVGVNFYPAFLTAGCAVLDDVVDHLIHMIEMGGEGKIGFGSDFDGIEQKPIGLDNPSDLPKLINRMRGRGLTEAEVVGIAGQNLLHYYNRI